MASRDFLNKDAQTPFCGYYSLAGAVSQLSTNFEPILEAARESFFPVGVSQARLDLRLRFWVDPDARSSPPWPKLYCRGLDHLIFAGFDSENSLLIDLRLRRAIGRFSPAMGGDRAYWKAVIFPVLLTLFGASVGITELHCGCVAQDGRGLLLAGDSGSGKSTLTLALAQAGFAFLSDDRTYISGQGGRLLAWGLPTLLKLRPDAAGLFPELRDFEPGVALDGERAFQIDPERQLHLRRSLNCEPRWLVFLERRASPGLALDEMTPAEAAARLQEDLLPEAPASRKSQMEAINRLAERGCWSLRYGGEPQGVAQALAQFCASPLKQRISHRVPSKP
jgi:hypothetical protein